jgi:hypothetical protein
VRAKPARALTLPRLPGKITLTAWELPADLPFEVWLTYGKQIMALGGACAWWLGDWWRSQPAYGERVEAVREHLQIEPATVRTYAWVAASVSVRDRHIDLTFKHHRLVAKYPPAEQKAWLGRAVEHRWTVEQLQNALAHDANARDSFGMPTFAIPTITTITADPDAPLEGDSMRDPPPPELPPSEPPPPPSAGDDSDADEDLLRTFNKAVSTLLRCMREPAKVFEGTNATPSRLRLIAGYLRNVAMAVDGHVIEHVEHDVDAESNRPTDSEYL